MTEQCPKAWQRLGAATLLIVFVWAVVLPRLGAVPAIHRHTQLLDDTQIDAAEHAAMTIVTSMILNLGETVTRG